MSFINPKIRYILVLDAIIFLIGVAGIYHLTERAGFNTTSDLEISVSDNHRLVFNKIINPELNNFFADQDTLKIIDTYPVQSVDELEMITDSRRIGDKVDLSISRFDEDFLLSVPLNAFYSLSYILIVLIVGIIFFFHGLFVLIKRPEDHSAKVYHWVSIGAAMIIMTTWGRYTIDPFGLGYIIRLFFCAAYAFTPMLFLHFSFIFPKDKGVNFRYVILPGYIIAMLLMLWTSISFLTAVLPIKSISYIRLYLLGFDTTRWFFIFLLIAGIINFIHSFFIASETAERKKILWLLVGMIGPLVFVILWQIPQALNYSAFLPEEAIILFASIMPLTFTISIIRYHVMDIYLIINRSTVYGVVLVFLLALYALIIATTMRLIDTFTTESSIIISAIAAIILASLFEPVRKKVQNIVDRQFFRAKYNYRIAQRKFLDEMNMGVDPKILALFTVDKLDELLKPHCINLMMRNDVNRRLTPYAKKKCIMITDDYLDTLTRLTENSSAQLFSSTNHLEPGIPFQPISLEKDAGISIVMPVRHQNGSLMGLLCLGKKKSENVYSMEDIDLLKTVITQLGIATERLKLQSRLLLKQEEAKRLDELNKMQSFFISSVSHDLQTPLTAINMYLDLLDAKKDHSQGKLSEYYDIIRGESDRLFKLINNVLDISKIERGVKEYSLTQLNLNDLLEGVYHSMKYQLSQHKFQVRLNIPESPIFIQGDEDSLDRAFTNLISNSIKYSGKEKYLSINLTLEGSSTIVKIEDHGVGIHPDDQKRIFNIFYRSGLEHIQSVSGAGLGLAIVDHVIKAHHGKIELNSTPGEGTTFIIKLPTDNTMEESETN
jgi:signal transduction histidine kinase